MKLQCLTAVITGIFLLTGCGDKIKDVLPCDLDITPVGEILGTAVPLTFGATLAMAAMKQTGLPCVSVTGSCVSYPCSGTVTIALDDRCVLPIGAVGNGSIIINGQWTSEDEAHLVAAYEGVTIDGASVWIREGAFTALVEGDTISMTYIDQDVFVERSQQVEITESGWTVKVFTAGTPGDTDDDEITINGGRICGGNSGFSEVILTNVNFSGGCRKNPYSGIVSILAFGKTTPAQLSFHSDCDGMVDVDYAMSPGCMGASIPLVMVR